LLTFNVHSSSYEFYLASAAAAWGVQHTYTLDFYFLLLSAAGIRKWHLSKWVRGAVRRGEKNATPVHHAFCSPFIYTSCNSLLPAGD
jgi:hypothetical protein